MSTKWGVNGEILRCWCKGGNSRYCELDFDFETEDCMNPEFCTFASKIYENHVHESEDSCNQWECIKQLAQGAIMIKHMWTSEMPSENAEKLALAGIGKTCRHKLDSESQHFKTIVTNWNSGTDIKIPVTTLEDTKTGGLEVKTHGYNHYIMAVRNEHVSISSNTKFKRFKCPKEPKTLPTLSIDSFVYELNHSYQIWWQDLREAVV
jgi:hypothetical protein